MPNFERQVFEEWVALRAKALATSMEIALESGEPDEKGFARMRKYPMATRHPSWQGNDITDSFAQFYRTAEALRLRVTSNDKLFKKQNWRERRGDEGKFDWGCKAGTMELFLQSPGQSGYRHFAITADGALYDALAMDAKSFDSADWKVESVQRDGFWQLTLTIPWSILGIDGAPNPGDVFHAVVINNAHKANEKTGETDTFAIGVPFPAYHDIGVGAALVIDDFAGRRPNP